VEDVRAWLGAHGEVFAEFLRQDSGCRAYGVLLNGERWFVKHAVESRATASLQRAIALHDRVRHRAIIGVQDVFPTSIGPALAYPWRSGQSLYPADAVGPEGGVGSQAAHRRFRRLPLLEVVRAIDDIIDAHVAVCAAGFVAVDLYDGCFLYDFEQRSMQICDLDEYRPGPFTVEGGRMPGSRRFMAPEELIRGAVIDERTTVFNLGRTAALLLQSDDGGWRGSDALNEVLVAATHDDPAERHATVAELASAWRAA
jgi:serine/threonine-protein kinase